MPDPAHAHAAKVAAARVYKLILQMLSDQEVGEVAVVVSWGHLQPVKRTHVYEPVVKVGRGQMAAVERAE